MWKKLVLSALALFLMAAANLNCRCRVSIGGMELEGLYSPRAVDRCIEVARITAEEILSSKAVLPKVERNYSLGLGGYSGDNIRMTDALLRASNGVGLLDGVYVNGLRIGAVEDGERLRAMLTNHIRDLMPSSAVYGSYTEELDIRRQYCRASDEASCADMVLLVSGIAPVIYTDSDGRLV